MRSISFLIISLLLAHNCYSACSEETTKKLIEQNRSTADILAICQITKKDGEVEAPKACNRGAFEDGVCLPEPTDATIKDDVRAKLYFRCVRTWPNDGYVSPGHGQCCDHLTGALQARYKVCRSQPRNDFTEVIKKLPWDKIVATYISGK